MKKHIIDTDKNPSSPYPGWTIEEHQKSGKIEWNAKEVSLFISDKQKSGYIEGNKLRKIVKNPLNATVLDYLLEHQKLIPESWKEETNGFIKWIYFWGTIYRNSDDDLFVRYLYWFDGRWQAYCNWLDGDWDVDSPSAVSASSSHNLEPQNSGTSDFNHLISDLQKRIEKLEAIVEGARGLLT